MKIALAAILLLGSNAHAQSTPPPATAPTTAPAWTGEWSNWTKKGASFSGANLRIQPCKDSACAFSFTTEESGGKSCQVDGELKVAADDQATTTLKKKTDCELLLSKKAGSPASVHAELKGSGCKQLCGSPKALAFPDELSKVSETPSLDPLPFPQCEAAPSPAVQELCYNADLANTYFKAVKVDDRARALQQTFYVAKDAQVPAPVFFWENCGNDDAKDCVAKGVKAFSDEANHAAQRIQKFKNQLESDLKAAAPSAKVKAEAKAEIEALKGKYKRKIKSGTMSGDKFEVTNDVTIENDEGDLAFDVLLNFFDEQECTLSGSAQAVKNGRFLYKEGGSSCRLLIFKEGDDLVLTDEPPNSCRKHCGKGATFFNARFPLSSRSK